MRHYETVFILSPVLSDDKVKEAVEKYEDLIRSKEAKIVASEHWGLKKLAYPIQRKKTGFYHLFEFQTQNSGLLSALELQLKRDEQVLRFLTVRLDKHAIEWASKRRERLKIQIDEAS